MSKWEHAIWVFVLGFLLATLLGMFSAAAEASTVSEYSHSEADGIHWPRLMAAMNEFWRDHPKDREGEQHAWEHVRKLDRGDLERFKVVDDAFKTWRDAMKRAGY
jgi:hypothetical protein